MQLYKLVNKLIDKLEDNTDQVRSRCAAAAAASVLLCACVAPTLRLCRACCCAMCLHVRASD